MIYSPTSLFLERKNEDGYFYIFVATKFENGMVEGRVYIPDVDNEQYIFEEVVTRDIKSSTLNFDMSCSDRLSNKYMSTDYIFNNPYTSETVH